MAMIESGIFKYFDIRMFDYVVSSGDTIAGIARKFNQSVPMLLKLNPQINPHQLKVGSVIKIEKNNEPDSDIAIISSKSNCCRRGC